MVRLVGKLAKVGLVRSMEGKVSKVPQEMEPIFHSIQLLTLPKCQKDS